MQISVIVAVAKNRVIGHKNSLPWHMPADLRHFKALTLGKTVIMGRQTYDSIGKPLPERRNIIISRNQSLIIPGCEVTHSLQAALTLAHNQPEVMIIGGAQIFANVALMVDQVYLTIVWENFKGDSYLPEIYNNWAFWR